MHIQIHGASIVKAAPPSPPLPFPSLPCVRNLGGKLIGSTPINLEHRWRNQQWRESREELGKPPREFRTLWDDLGTNRFKHVQCPPPLNGTASLVLPPALVLLGPPFR